MSFINELLEFIVEAGQLLPGLDGPYGHARRLRRATYYGAVVGLEKRGFIEKKRKKNRIYYVPTEKGRQHDIPKPQIVQKRTDGLLTVIIFDIPEAMSRQRKIFRRYLQRRGYSLLQKSVLISTNELSLDIKEIIDELKIRQYVSVLLSKHYYF